MFNFILSRVNKKWLSHIGKFHRYSEKIMSTEYLQKQTRKILSKEDIDEIDFRDSVNLIFSDEIPDSTIFVSYCVNI